MPNFDGTGPMGKGHLTGRERGGCRKSGTQLADGRNIFNGLYRRGRLHREESGRGRGGRCDGIKKGFNK